MTRFARGLAAFAIAASTVAGILVSGTSAQAAPDASFDLAPIQPFKSCFTKRGEIARASAEVFRGAKADTLKLRLSGFKPGLAFDLFSIQRSPLDAGGQPVNPFNGFGFSWYQSDIEVGADGTAEVTIKTILLDQAFGLVDRPNNPVAPINTFHIGFWFNDPADAAACGFTGFTPFNGDHRAGPLAFVTKPNALTRLGPLCTKPITTTTPPSCEP